jgi:hypothetical protein
MPVWGSCSRRISILPSVNSGLSQAGMGAGFIFGREGTLVWNGSPDPSRASTGSGFARAHTNAHVRSRTEPSIQSGPQVSGGISGFSTDESCYGTSDTSSAPLRAYCQARGVTGRAEERPTRWSNTSMQQSTRRTCESHTQLDHGGSAATLDTQQSRST